MRTRLQLDGSALAIPDKRREQNQKHTEGSRQKVLSEFFPVRGQPPAPPFPLNGKLVCQKKHSRFGGLVRFRNSKSCENHLELFA